MNTAATRILVIDDDPTARLLFKAALSRLGFRVSMAEGGEEGLRMFSDTPFDMVLLDIGMPGMNGFEVCKMLRAQAGPLLPIMIVTGMDDLLSVEQAYAAGATDFIAKPMTWSLIGHRVMCLLRTHQALADLRAAHAQARQLASFDALTQLPNRQLFAECLQREIRRAGQGGTRLAVLVLDLDGLHTINDTLGHSAGDLALQWAARQLRQATRPTDVLSHATDPATDPDVARLGSDEFTALLQGISNPQDVLTVAQRIQHLVREPLVLDGHEVRLSVSIGIALFPEDGYDAATLLQHADTALHQAKDAGRDRCRFYSAALTQAAMAHMALMSELRLAMQRSELGLLYQPQINAASGCIEAVQALLHWQHPIHGSMKPQDLMTAAEQGGLMIPIGYQALRTACEDCAQWQRQGRGLRVAVNVSASQFRDPRLVEEVLAVLGQTGLAPGLLELEVTESVVMADVGATLRVFKALQHAGVRLSLDEFGIGYSSLNVLERLPITTLKVAPSFIQGLPDDPQNCPIVVKAVVAMAGSLGLRVMAQGVNTLAQARALTHLACHALQGDLFSPPVAAGALTALLPRRWLLREPPPARHGTVLLGRA